jgi:hypothetical protein
MPSSFAPHLGQKAKSSAHKRPQPAHERGCFAPHFGQNEKPLWTSKPHPAQFIDQDLA